MTKREFQKRARVLFLKRNPTATMQWMSAKHVTYPTGVQGWYGRFTAEAPGHRSSVMIARGDSDSIMIN
jgi:hypothetical protein